MKTSIQWWSEVKNNQEKLYTWLQKQYFGEKRASEKIRDLADETVNNRDKEVLYLIASQESLHARWIHELLVARTIPVLAEHEDRYWKKAMPIVNTDDAFAVAAHAEKMRLNRIKVIAEDEDAPKDIRMAFQKILKDELFHEKAFREMASAEAYARASGPHEAAMASLGLVI